MLGNQLGSRQDACPTDLQMLKDPNLKITKRRLPHWELDGSIYFVTFNTWEKLELSEAARQVVLDACQFFDGQRYKVFAIAVMPDHVHWLIQPLQKSENEYWSLSSIMHSIKSYSAKQIPKVMKHIGTVWQIEWHDRIIREEQEFENTWEYIRQNPLKADLCKQPEDYPFLWQSSNSVGQASSLQLTQNDRSNGNRQDDRVNKSRQDDRVNEGRHPACPTDVNLIPVAQASSLPIIEEEYDPDTATTISRGVGKCPNCGNVIENSVIMQAASNRKLDHQLYAVAYKKGKSNLEFRLPDCEDLNAIEQSSTYLESIKNDIQQGFLIPDLQIPEGKDLDEQIRIFCPTWADMFNPRQLLTLITYVEILNEAKEKLRLEYEPEKVEAIATYLALVFDRCADMNCRLAHWDSSRAGSKTASAQHSLNLMWNYPEICGAGDLWHWCADALASDYQTLCALINQTSNSTLIPGINSVGQASSLQPHHPNSLQPHHPNSLQPNPNVSESKAGKMPALRVDIVSASADSLVHIADQSVDTIVTDPPYYSTIQYAELSDFFYVWQKRTLGDIFPISFGQNSLTKTAKLLPILPASATWEPHPKNSLTRTTKQKWHLPLPNTIESCVTMA